MLRRKILGSTAADWFGRPLKQIPSGDLWRFEAIQTAAAWDYRKAEAG